MYPSYLGRPPAEVGSASAGSLSADQWRTFCLINLPISLIRIWNTTGTSERRTLLLTNFLDLVTAVKRGTARRLNSEVISSYQSHILRYVRGLRELFPDLDLTPNHHIALHLDEVLKAFGPAHAYWSFPFERLIGLIRQIGNNARPSESSSLHGSSNMTYCLLRRDGAHSLPVFLHGEQSESSPFLASVCRGPSSVRITATDFRQRFRQRSSYRV